MGHIWPRMAMNATQYKIVMPPILFGTLCVSWTCMSISFTKLGKFSFFSFHLKPFFCSSVFVSVCAFNVWPKTTLLLPVWPRDAKRLDTSAYSVKGATLSPVEIGIPLTYKLQLTSGLFGLIVSNYQQPEEDLPSCQAYLTLISRRR